MLPKVTKVAKSSDGMVIVQVTFNTKARDFGGTIDSGEFAG